MEFTDFVSTSAIRDGLALVFQVANHFQIKSISLDKLYLFLSLRRQCPAFSEGPTQKGFPLYSHWLRDFYTAVPLGMMQCNYVKLTFPPYWSCWGWKCFTLIKWEMPFTDPEISLGSSHFGQMPFVFLLPFTRRPILRNGQMPCS